MINQLKILDKGAVNMRDPHGVVARLRTAVLLSCALSTSTGFAREELIGLSPNGQNAVGTNVLRIDLDPFSATLAGQSDVNFLSGLAVQPGTGILFASSGNQDQGRLFELDPATGATTLVADIFGDDLADNLGISGLAFASDGTLYGTTPYRAQGVSDRSDLFRIDPTTGEAMLIGSTNQPGVDAIAFDSTDTLYGVSTFNTGRLLAIDTNTGLATSLGLLRNEVTNSSIINVFEIQGLAFDSHDQLYGSAGAGDGRIIRIDPATVTFQNVGDAAQRSVSDLAFVVVADVSGDFNGDGSLTLDDLEILTNAIHVGETDRQYDLDTSSFVDNSDRDYWVIDLLQTWIGDSNLDGIFDSGDLIAVFSAGQYDDAILHNSTWSTGDWNGDQDFDSSDLIVAFSDGGYDQGRRSVGMVVPEPFSLAGLMFGVVAVVSQLLRVEARTQR